MRAQSFGFDRGFAFASASQSGCGVLADWVVAHECVRQVLLQQFNKAVLGIVVAPRNFRCGLGIWKSTRGAPLVAINCIR